VKLKLPAMDDLFGGGCLCGAVTCERERLPIEMRFHIGAFEQAERFQPTRHIFPEERLPCLHLGQS
jgi:hypothetical protein